MDLDKLIGDTSKLNKKIIGHEIITIPVNGIDQKCNFYYCKLLLHNQVPEKFIKLEDQIDWYIFAIEEVFNILSGEKVLNSNKTSNEYIASLLKLAKLKLSHAFSYCAIPKDKVNEELHLPVYFLNLVLITVPDQSQLDGFTITFMKKEWDKNKLCYLTSISEKWNI